MKRKNTEKSDRNIYAALSLATGKMSSVMWKSLCHLSCQIHYEVSHVKFVTKSLMSNLLRSLSCQIR